MLTQLTAEEEGVGCAFSYLSLTAGPLHLLHLPPQGGPSRLSPHQTPLYGISKPVITSACRLKKTLSIIEAPREGEAGRGPGSRVLGVPCCPPSREGGPAQPGAPVPVPQSGLFLLAPGAGDSGERVRGYISTMLTSAPSLCRAPMLGTSVPLCVFTLPGSTQRKGFPTPNPHHTRVLLVPGLPTNSGVFLFLFFPTSH